MDKFFFSLLLFLLELPPGLGWQEGNYEGKGQLGRVKQRLIRTSEKIPSRRHKIGG
jgi:hypothetical protein